MSEREVWRKSFGIVPDAYVKHGSVWPDKNQQHYYPFWNGCGIHVGFAKKVDAIAFALDYVKKICVERRDAAIADLTKFQNLLADESAWVESEAHTKR